jgi:hypothetical protein
MADLSDYLKKFRVFLRDRTEEKNVAFQVLHPLNLCDTPESLEIKDSVLIIKTTPAVKNELFLRKREIMKLLQENGVKIIDLRW